MLLARVAKLSRCSLAAASKVIEAAGKQTSHADARRISSTPRRFDVHGAVLQPPSRNTHAFPHFQTRRRESCAVFGSNRGEQPPTHIGKHPAKQQNGEYMSQTERFHGDARPFNPPCGSEEAQRRLI